MPPPSPHREKKEKEKREKTMNSSDILHINYSNAWFRNNKYKQIHNSHFFVSSHEWQPP